MPLWNRTTLPKNLTREEKRNIVATDIGYVRKLKRGNTTKEELIVPINGVANSSNWGAPIITDMWHSNTQVPVNTQVSTFVSYSEPLTVAGSSRVTVANTAGGSVRTAVATNNVIGAENTLQFNWTPTIPGTYKIQAQTIANNTGTAINLRSQNTGTETGSLVINGVISNTAGIVIVTS